MIWIKSLKASTSSLKRHSPNPKIMMTLKTESIQGLLSRFLTWRMFRSLLITTDESREERLGEGFKRM